MERSGELFEAGGPMILEESSLCKGVSKTRALALMHNGKRSGRTFNGVLQITNTIKNQILLHHTGVDPICRNPDALSITGAEILPKDSKVLFSRLIIAALYYVSISGEPDLFMRLLISSKFRYGKIAGASF